MNARGHEKVWRKAADKLADSLEEVVRIDKLEPVVASLAVVTMLASAIADAYKEEVEDAPSRL